MTALKCVAAFGLAAFFAYAFYVRYWKWRECIAVVVSNVSAQTSGSAKAECEGIMNALVPFAQQMLEKHGEFFPFGGTMKNNGEITHTAGYDGRERPPSADIIRLLNDSFRSGARSGQYKATALVYDVRVVLPSTGQESDAVAVALDHRDNYSVVVYFPYQIKGGKVAFGDVFAEKGEANVFK
jgi:hypothetical protein